MVQRVYMRPQTRGELRDKLASGISCEVAGHVASMTVIMLDGWLNFNEYTIRPSENEGWMVFEPIQRREGK